VVHTGDRIAVRSTDGALHSAHLRRADGTSALNVAVMASGESAIVTIDEPAGEILTLDCAVHGAREPSARVVVVP
jgi:hypothetical protein